MSEYSGYLSNLLQIQRDVGERYLQKIALIGGVDPFTLTNDQLKFVIVAVPEVMDIVAYLVLTHSFYSSEQMKTYKSLDSYRYFEAGFVEKMGCKKFANNCKVIVEKVKHSQRRREASLDCWVIIEAAGGVASAHCTCLAGAGEVCSHVEALLYAAESATKLNENRSCTDVKAGWLAPSPQQVPIVPISKMEWPERQKKSVLNVPASTNEDMQHFLRELEEKGCVAGLMRVVQPICDKPEALNKLQHPTFSELFLEDNLKKSLQELQQLGHNFSIALDDQAISDIESATQEQRQCQEWYIQRTGCITASLFKAVCKTSVQKPSLSLLKTVCYPKKMAFSTKATKWGILNEKRAVESYCNRPDASDHQHLIINTVGLCVSKRYPALGATPDRLIYCDCCLGGCLEVKCPYTLSTTEVTLQQYVDIKSSCLVRSDGKVKLKESHDYYYQIQLQMFCTTLPYCDFVIWCPWWTFVERILYNADFLHANIEKAVAFHAQVILPELLGKYFTRQGGIEAWCICRGVDDGRPMIKCANDNCNIH